MRRLCWLLASGIWLAPGMASQAAEGPGDKGSVLPPVHPPTAPSEPVCGHRHGGDRGEGCGECRRRFSLRRWWGWLTYRPLPTPADCNRCKLPCNPVCQPPLYAYFLNMYGPGSCPGGPLQPGCAPPPPPPPLPPLLHEHSERQPDERRPGLTRLSGLFKRPSSSP